LGEGRPLGRKERTGALNRERRSEERGGSGRGVSVGKKGREEGSYLGGEEACNGGDSSKLGRTLKKGGESRTHGIEKCGGALTQDP